LDNQVKSDSALNAAFPLEIAFIAGRRKRKLQQIKDLFEENCAAFPVGRLSEEQLSERFVGTTPFGEVGPKEVFQGSFRFAVRRQPI
jgi:hypothetical protein